MQQDGQFTGARYHCAFLPTFASVPSQLHAPSAQVAVDSPGAENVVRSLHQECSQVRIALFADVHLRLALSRVTPSRLETHVAGGIPALAKTVWVYLSHHRFQCTLQLWAQIVGRLRLHPARVAYSASWTQA